METKRPNILLLMTDQHKAAAAGFMGNSVVPTPFLDSLSANGMVFDNAYSVSSICTPSRTSIFTGVHPLVHDVTCHQNRAPFNLPQLSEILQGQGYYTAVAGHYEPQRNLGRGWHEQVEFLERGQLMKSFQSQAQSARADVGWSAGGFGEKPQDGNSSLLTDRMVRMLDQIKATDAPFFLHAAYDAPHPPYFAPPPFDTIVDPADVQLPPPFDPDHSPRWQETVREELRLKDATETDIRRLIAVYYGMIAYADSEILRLFSEMRTRGLLENTWVIFTSDHGDYTGEKGMFAKTESLYECLLHVPLCIVPPPERTGPRGVRIGGLVESVDIFPTVLGMAGISVPWYAQGHDLREWVSRGANTPLRETVFAQVGNYHGFLGSTFPTGMPGGGRHPGLLMSGRSREYSYVCDPDYGDEAYDLRADPFELRNLIDGSPEPGGVTELRESVTMWEARCADLKTSLKIVSGDRGFVRGWE